MNDDPLRAALERYGQHDEICAYVEDRGACDCGWQATLERLAPTALAAPATDEPDCHCDSECAACYDGHVCDSRRHKPCRPAPTPTASATDEGPMTWENRGPQWADDGPSGWDYDSVMARKAARDAASATDERLDVEEVVIMLENEGVIRWGDDGHRDRFLRHVRALAPSATEEGPLPTPADLRGLANGMTGGQPSEEYVRSIRDARPAVPEALDEG